MSKKQNLKFYKIFALLQNLHPIRVFTCVPKITSLHCIYINEFVGYVNYDVADDVDDTRPKWPRDSDSQATASRHLRIFNSLLERRALAPLPWA